MARDRALTLEALRVMDAIDRRGSFAAAADELGGSFRPQLYHAKT